MPFYWMYRLPTKNCQGSLRSVCCNETDFDLERSREKEAMNIDKYLNALHSQINTILEWKAMEMTMSGVATRSFILCLLAVSASTQQMRSFMMTKMNGLRLGCANTTCSPYQTFPSRRSFDCQSACLVQDQCNALSFDMSNLNCFLFNNVPASVGTVLPDANTITMVANAGTRLPTGM
jgi:hypothetical protein